MTHAIQKENVWDYPRPPRLERTTRNVVIEVGGILIADSHAAYRVLETSHPPTFYLPPGDVAMRHLVPNPRRSFCEWKGRAAYYDVVMGDRRIEEAAWYYPTPFPAFAAIRDHIAFYPSKLDGCFVDGDRVRAQPGDFYGGWITPDLEGPFKGGPGSLGW